MLDAQACIDEILSQVFMLAGDQKELIKLSRGDGLHICRVRRQDWLGDVMMLSEDGGQRRSANEVSHVNRLLVTETLTHQICTVTVESCVSSVQSNQEKPLHK
jgi:hypothetical protein